MTTKYDALLRTGARKTVRELKPQMRKLADLVLPYLRDDNQFDWVKLDREQPNWTDQFPSRHWAVASATRLRLTGRMAFEKKQAGGTPAPTEDLSDSPRGSLAGLQRISADARRDAQSQLEAGGE